MEAIYETHQCPFCGEQANKVSPGYTEEKETSYQCTKCGEYVKVINSGQ